MQQRAQRFVRFTVRRATAQVRFTRGGKALASLAGCVLICLVVWLASWLLRAAHRHQAAKPAEPELVDEAEPVAKDAPAAAANETEPTMLPEPPLPPSAWEEYDANVDPPWPPSPMTAEEMRAAGAWTIDISSDGGAKVDDPLPALLRASASGRHCFAISVPTTSRRTAYGAAEETPFFAFFLPSLLATSFPQPQGDELFFLLLLAYDAGDSLFDTPAAVGRMAAAARDAIGSRAAAVQIYRLENLPPGHVTWAHNALLARAHAAGCLLFGPMEDDLRFRTPRWPHLALAALRASPLEPMFGVVALNETRTDEPSLGRFHGGIVGRPHFDALEHAYEPSVPNGAHHGVLTRTYEPSGSAFFLPEAEVEDASHGAAGPHGRRYAPAPGMEWIEEDLADSEARRLRRSLLLTRRVSPFDVQPAPGDTWLQRHATPQERARAERARAREREREAAEAAARERREREREAGKAEAEAELSAREMAAAAKAAKAKAALGDAVGGGAPAAPAPAGDAGAGGPKKPLPVS